MNEETLKLPICPRCNDTKNVIEMDVLILLYVHEVYLWFKCENCGIKWHFVEGIREKEDLRPCFG